MVSAQFNVVVDGQLLPGFDHDTVLAQLQQQLKLPPAKAAQLLAGNAITVKRDVTADIADAYCARLQSLGVVARRIAATVSTSTSTSTTTVKPAAIEFKNYFAGVSTPPPKIGNRGAFQRALYRATARLFGVVVGYVALNLFVLLATFFYLIHFGYLLTAPPILFSATIFVLPLLALLTLCLFLLRPFLPIANAIADSVVVTQNEQPHLFYFVEQLCAALAVKPPAEIAFSAQPGNSIAPLSGFKNLWANHYRLTLSLPLLQPCDIAIYAGIVAGDLRTGATAAGLRYSGSLQLIRHRTLSCIAGKDWLQQQINRLHARAERSAALLDTTRVLFDRSNIFLQKFSARAETTHTLFTRQLLFERDRYLARMAGSTQLSTALMIAEKIQTATKDALAKNTEDRIDAGLVDNLPALIQHYYESLDEKFERELRRRWDSEAIPRRDAPPIPRERLEQLAVATGAIDCKDAATSLLKNAAENATAVTQQNYRAAGYEFSVDTLLAADDLTYTATQDILLRQQAALYFNNWFKPFRFWKLAEYKLIRDMPLQDAAEQLSVCVNEVRRLSPDRFKLLAEYERVQNQLFEILIAQHVLAAGKTYPFRYVTYDGTSLQPLQEDRQMQLSVISEKLALQEAVMGGRITLGLRLCGQSEFDITNLHDTLRLINDSGTRLQKLALDVYQLEQLLPRHYKQREADYSAPIKRLEEKIRDTCTLLLVRLSDIPCPLDTRHHSLKSYVEATLDQPFGGESKSPVGQRARRLLDILFTVNEKLSLLAADYGTIAEEAYRIEPIKLVGTAE
jgi:hypothetical protein